MSKLWLPTNPQSLRPAPRAPDVFDHGRQRNAGSPGIEQSTPEWDNRIIATAVELGCPRWVAEQVRTHPPTRFALLSVWCDVQDAAEGDKEALERCEYYKAMWAQGRAEGSISDTPERVTGFLVDRD